MNLQVISHRKKKGYVQLSTLIMLAFCSAFFPRVLTLLKFPSVVNLLHLGIVPVICILTLYKTQITNKNQINISRAILLGLSLLFAVMVASALINGAGVINVLVDFILLGEPFLLLLAIISIPMSTININKFRTLLIYSGIINTLFAFVQRYIFNLQRLPGLEDNIKGVFIAQGAGHVIGASVALTFGLYYFINVKTVPVWIRFLLLLATFWHMVLADGKQALLVLLVAGILCLTTQFKSAEQLLKYLLTTIIVVAALAWCIQNLPAFRAFNTWIIPELYGSDGEATQLKLSVFHIIPSYYHSSLNWLLGLGPGHTVGRLGGWMLREYAYILEPLGSTTHPASNAVWAVVSKSWLGDRSSMFSPLFGWAGIWGDLGLLGLAAYAYLLFITWRYLCLDNFSKFLILSVFVFGLILSQMEEPGYMLFIFSLIGIQWQRVRLKSKNQVFIEPSTYLPRKTKTFKVT